MSQTISLPIFLRVLRRLNFPRRLGVLERVYGPRLRAYGISWLKCANGVTWKLDLSDPCHRWIVFGKYEGGNGIDFAVSVLKSGGVYVDSGANIGQWLLYLGHIQGLRSLAFEPVSTQRAWLTECVDAQDRWNVDILNFGLGIENSELNIQVNGAQSTLNMDWYKDQSHPCEKVVIRRLDDVLKNQQVDCVDLWKLDVEGAELDALMGAQGYLSDGKIKTIYFECHPANYRAVVEFLKSVNYQVFDLIGKTLVAKTASKIADTTDLVARPISSRNQNPD